MAGGGSGSGHTILDETTPLAARSKLKLTGAGVVAVDDAGNDQTVVTIPGATSGSGAVGYVNVMDYGAVGNGIADDGPAFAAALNAAKGSVWFSAKTVIVPPGQYLIQTRPVIEDANFVRMVGIGRPLVIGYSIGADLFTFKPSSPGSFNEHIEIDGLSFRMPADYTAYDAGYNFAAIALEGIVWSRFTNCIFYGFGQGIRATYSLSNLVDRCYFYAGHGIKAFGNATYAIGANWWIVRDCIINSKVGVEFDIGAGNSVVNCDIEGCATRGLIFGAYIDGMGPNTVRECWFEANAAGAILNKNGSFLRVVGNIVAGPAPTIEQQTASIGGCLIRENHLHGNGIKNNSGSQKVHIDQNWGYDSAKLVNNGSGLTIGTNF